VPFIITLVLSVRSGRENGRNSGELSITNEHMGDGTDTAREGRGGG